MTRHTVTPTTARTHHTNWPAVALDALAMALLVGAVTGILASGPGSWLLALGGFASAVAGAGRLTKDVAP